MKRRFKNGDYVRSYMWNSFGHVIGYSRFDKLCVHIETGDIFQYPEEEWELVFKPRGE
jgi:hypothetical protein